LFAREQPPLLRQRHHTFQERGGDLAVQQPLAVLGEHGRVPHQLVHVQANEPAEEQVVVELLQQLPLAADRIQDLEQLGPQLLRRDRRPAGPGVQPLEARGQLTQQSATSPRSGGGAVC